MAGGGRLAAGDGGLRAGRCLEAYFDGWIDAIDAVEVAMGGTVFQREVWAALRGIPAGSHLNYGRLAERIGRPGRCAPWAPPTARIRSASWCHAIV